MRQENCVKMIVASSIDNKMYLYENGKVIKIIDEVYFGKNGVSNEKKEGDLCTPKGIFSLGFAFGTRSLNIAYPYYKINENMYWVCDSYSKFYNEWVEVTEEEKNFPFSYMKTSPCITWNDAERLSDYPVQYELALIIEYNKEKVKEKGSAIFLHVKNREYTAGCIATTKENLEFIIKWLGKGKGIIEIK